MFNFGLAMSFVKQRFRYFEKQQQLSDEYWKNRDFAKVNNQIDVSKLTRQANAGHITEWAGKSNFHASVVDAVSQSREGPGASDRVISAQ